MTPLQDHPEYRHLVNAVRAAPDDDLPRLVLADWLEEHDAADWAEFIRCHCEAARHPHAARIWADTFTDAEGVNPDWQAALASARRVKELWPAVANMHFANETSPQIMALVADDGTCLFLYPRQRYTPQLDLRRGFLDQMNSRLVNWFAERRHSHAGPLLVVRQPVREVSFIDREWGGPQGSWTYYSDTDDIDTEVRHCLPWCLGVRLQGEVSFSHSSSAEPQWFAKDYHTREAASAALSAAAIEWALEEAGRPTL